MRAVYHEDIGNNEVVILKDNLAHHLLSVVRVKLGEKILGLNGCGLSAQMVITEISKKQLTLKITNTVKHQSKQSFDLVVGKVKKEAMDSVIKQSCELGIGNIFIVETDYSQRYTLNKSRCKKLLIAGIEQSNNPFLPKISETNLKDIDYSQYKNNICFSTETNTDKSLKIEKGPTLIIVGPEGGFSPEELEHFYDCGKVSYLNLGTSIMRTPTAISCAVGYCLAANK